MDVVERTSARIRPAVAALAALLTAACVVTTTGPSQQPTDDPLSRVDRQELATDVKTAVEVTDAFWRRAFPEEFGRSYRPPRVAGGYTGTGGPACAGQPSVPFNAFYCPSEDLIAWDDSLMAAGFDRIGDAWVYLIIAHEWAHAIQARLEQDQVSVAAELQADCLAGASLFGAARAGLVKIEPGDIEELSQTLVAVSDDFPWTKESDHGNAQQRISAFTAGSQGGVKACT